MVIRNGTPLVKTGDICKQGDILVSGEVPILNDSQEVVRVEYVPADADIYVRHQIAYYLSLIHILWEQVKQVHAASMSILRANMQNKSCWPQNGQ